jgi:hypothetical protein
MSACCGDVLEGGRGQSKKAIAAVFFGVLGLFLWLFGAVPALVFALLPERDLRLGLFLWILGAAPAIVFALMAKQDIRKNKLLRGRLLANLGLALGAFEFVAPFLVVCVVMLHGPFGGKERVAHFNLSGTLDEKPQTDVVGAFMGQPSTFYNLLKRLKDAKDDPAVKAAILTVNDLQVHLSEMEELRAAPIDFASSGKKVFAHCEEAGVSLPLFMTLASATRLSIAPTVRLSLEGLYAESLYLKDALAKLGVEADALHMGDYKAGDDLFVRTEPSDAAKENMNWLLDGQYESWMNMLAESRHKTAAEVKALIDKGFVTTDQALKEGLIDAVEYQDDLVAQIKREYGSGVLIDNDYHKEPAPEVNTAHPFRSILNVATYFARLARPKSQDHIGLIYLTGAISTGAGDPSQACSGDLRAAFK